MTLTVSQNITTVNITAEQNGNVVKLQPVLVLNGSGSSGNVGTLQEVTTLGNTTNQAVIINNELTVGDDSYSLILLKNSSVKALDNVLEFLHSDTIQLVAPNGINIQTGASNFKIKADNLTAERTAQAQDKSGTIAYLSDITDAIDNITGIDGNL